ncbi:MAG: FAD-binding oxidoreductase, partial [Actinomycetota bacterium]|nr:FAD-binding oxidoreductase [Actinomycetota bacterium]
GRVRTVRAQMLATARAPEVDIPRPVYARFGYDYWQQLPDRRVVLGGLRDQFPATESTDRAVPTSALQRQLDVLLRDGLGVRAAVTHRWAGVIAFTDDRLPVLAEVRPGVWVAGAYSGTGNVLGSLCGRAAAQLAVGAPSLLTDLLPAG